MRRDSILFEWIKKVFAQRGVIKDCAMRVKKFLFDFILLPAKWIKTARQWVLKIFTTRLASGENGIRLQCSCPTYSLIQNQKEKPEPGEAMPVTSKKELKKLFAWKKVPVPKHIFSLNQHISKTLGNQSL